MKPEIIVALDYDEFEPAAEIVKNLGSSLEWYKVGLELFVSAGPRIIEFLKENDKKIFLDLKFHDISNTVKKVSLAALKYGANIVNMHASGGVGMMKETADAVSEYCVKNNTAKPMLIAVTLLTSLDESYLKDNKLNFASTDDYVLHLAKEAKRSGMDGVVSSAKETPLIKKELGSEFITVTPGIRPSFASTDDQKRVVTPKDAKAMGTDFMVIGRPITKAEDPVWAAEKIKEELI